MSQSIEEKVVSVLERILGKTFNAEAYDVPRNEIEGWDSLIHMEIIFACEDEFDVELSAEELANIQTINELMSILTGKLT